MRTFGVVRTLHSKHRVLWRSGLPPVLSAFWAMLLLCRMSSFSNNLLTTFIMLVGDSLYANISTPATTNDQRTTTMASSYHSEFHCGSSLHRLRYLHDRLFDINAHTKRDSIETQWKREWWTLLACPVDGVPHPDSVVIAVDGACRGNGTPNARAAAGIFFHQANHQWNEALLLPAAYNTCQRAELYAALRALTAAGNLRMLNLQMSGRRKYRRPGPMRRLRRVIIEADSEYLVKGMTVWMANWKCNGYRNANGGRVENEDLFRLLDEQVNKLVAMGVEVQFWHVPRELNTAADRSANAALDGTTATQAMYAAGA